MSAPVVQVKDGKLKGFFEKNVNGGQYFSFRGIPYAQPPIGDLRFKDPQIVKPWDGVRDATKKLPKAAQYDGWLHINSLEENCLYLNVATNSLSGKRPVMVWIHGGGFVMGTSHGDMYGPDHLLRHDIVYVAITYRLACFGFLNLDIPEASGNQGLKDQVTALKWVKENIHVFGGDPENVTIFGESAGSVSVHLLTLSPLAKGLFHKAISQSGCCLNPWGFQDKPVDFALRFTEILGKKTSDPKEAWKFLMAASTEKLVEAHKKMKIGKLGFDLILGFVPSVDRTCPQPFMPESPRGIYKRGVEFPYLLGYTADEGILSMAEPGIEKSIPPAMADFPNVLARELQYFDLEKVKKISDRVRKYYFGDKKMSTKEMMVQWAKLKGDIQFVIGIQEFVELQMNVTATATYLYRFSYLADYFTYRTFTKTELKGSCHGDDLGALFHANVFNKDKTYAKGSRDLRVLRRMTKMWTNFAKTGNPTPELDETITCIWKPLKKGEKYYLDINDDLVLGQNPDQEDWDFWKTIMAELQ